MGSKPLQTKTNGLKKIVFPKKKEPQENLHLKKQIEKLEGLVKRYKNAIDLLGQHFENRENLSPETNIFTSCRNSLDCIPSTECGPYELKS